MSWRFIWSVEEELKCDNLSIINWDYEGIEEFKNRKIKFIPLWKWSLQSEYISGQ